MTQVQLLDLAAAHRRTALLARVHARLGFIWNVGGRHRRYKFHSVFGPSAAATDIYRDVLTAPVDSLIDDGYNVAIFAYGQTGSGKTFTMAGSEDSAGIAALVFRHVFEGRGGGSGAGGAAEGDSGDAAAAATDEGGVDEDGGGSGLKGAAPASISLSIMEIYNEVVYDLLNNRAKVELKTAKGSAGGPPSASTSL